MESRGLSQEDTQSKKKQRMKIEWQLVKPGLHAKMVSKVCLCVFTVCACVCYK